MRPPTYLALLAAAAALLVVVLCVLHLARRKPSGSTPSTPSANAVSLALRAPAEDEPDATLRVAIDLIQAVVELPVTAFVDAARTQPSVLRRITSQAREAEPNADTSITVWAIESDRDGAPPRITGLHSHQPNIPTTLGMIGSATLPDYMAQRFVVAIHGPAPASSKLTLDFS